MLIIPQNAILVEQDTESLFQDVFTICIKTLNKPNLLYIECDKTQNPLHWSFYSKTSVFEKAFHQVLILFDRFLTCQGKPEWTFTSKRTTCNTLEVSKKEVPGNIL